MDVYEMGSYHSRVNHIHDARSNICNSDGSKTRCGRVHEKNKRVKIQGVCYATVFGACAPAVVCVTLDDAESVPLPPA
jgi:hypothetical protein